MHDTDATMITSRRSNSAWVAACRRRSISSLRERVLLDVRVRAREVRLRLVVVEVADEVLDRVVREELAELGVQLGGQRLVVGQDQRRLLVLLDELRRGVGLARARDAQEHLAAHAASEAVRQPLDRLRLVAGGLERGHEAEVRHGPILALERLFDTHSTSSSTAAAPPIGAGGQGTSGACPLGGAPTHSDHAPTCPEVLRRGTPTPAGSTRKGCSWSSSTRTTGARAGS